MILLVEDNDITRGATAELLHARGFAVREAATGAGAVLLLTAVLPRVLVLDLVLPGDLDGPEVLRQLRTLPGWGEVRVIVTTAMPEAAMPVLPVAVYRVLQKPFGVEELVGTIAECAPQEVGVSGKSGAP